MIVCDICKQAVTGEMRFTLTVVIGGSLRDSRPIDAVHACSQEHYIVALARVARVQAEGWKLEGALEQARAELAPPAAVLPKGPYR